MTGTKHSEVLEKGKAFEELCQKQSLTLASTHAGVEEGQALSKLGRLLCAHPQIAQVVLRRGDLSRAIALSPTPSSCPLRHSRFMSPVRCLQRGGMPK